MNNCINNHFIIFIPYCEVYSPYIIECLDSILNNDYENYEIIFVNDGADNISFLYDHKLNSNKKITVISSDINYGPAFSKWKFIEYIKNNNFDMNDIAIVIDGDDCITLNALSVINKEYNDNKCWVTFGDTFSTRCSFINLHTNNAIELNGNYESIRSYKSFFSNHPRTFKIHLAKYINKDIFLYNNRWLQKGTDLTILCDLFELAGNENIKMINKKIYYYRTHDNNSFHSITNEERIFKEEGLHYIKTRPRRVKINEEIHIVMCCWKRLHNLNNIITDLNNQICTNNIHLHLVNNNSNNKDFLDLLTNRKYSKLTIHVGHYNNEFYAFQRFLYINSVILPNFLCDYVIIIDDDQRFSNSWIKDLWEMREPKTYKGWYCKYWGKNTNYWSGSHYKYNDLVQNINNGTEAHYVGTGGAIIDINIFRSDSLLFSIPNDLPDKVTVLNIEDLWLSFICNLYGYIKSRTLLAPFIVKADEVSLCVGLIKEKEILLKYFINYDFFDSYNTKIPINTVNILDDFKLKYPYQNLYIKSEPEPEPEPEPERNINTDTIDHYQAMLDKYRQNLIIKTQESESKSKTDHAIQVITELYETIFLRVPDVGGLEHWTQHYNNGMSKEAIKNVMMNSKEAKLLKKNITKIANNKNKNKLAPQFGFTRKW